MAELVPINYISTAKQDLFDIIIGQKIPEGASVLGRYPIKGDYETIYKMMINREMILAAAVRCYTDGTQETTPLLNARIEFCTHPEGTVDGKPVIEVDADDETLIYIDCNNAIYWTPGDIPFDAPLPGDTGFVVDDQIGSGDGGDGK